MKIHINNNKQTVIVFSLLAVNIRNKNLKINENRNTAEARVRFIKQYINIHNHTKNYISNKIKRERERKKKNEHTYFCFAKDFLFAFSLKYECLYI